MTTYEQSLSNPSDVPVYLKLAAVTMIWGGTFVAGRFLADSLSPLFAASLRFLLASVALLLFLLLARVPLARPSPRQWLQLALLGFFGIFFYNLCFFYGLHYINASRASLIVALNPAVIGLASWLLFKERLSRAKVFGIAICIAGASLVIVSRNPQLLAGNRRCLDRRSVDLRLCAGLGRLFAVLQRSESDPGAGANGDVLDSVGHADAVGDQCCSR